MLILYIILGLISFLAIVYVILGMYISYRVNFIEKRTENFLYRKDWRENIPHNLIDVPHQRIYIKSKLGYDISARFFPSENKNSHKYLLMLHGYNNCSLTCGKYAVMFNEKDINCFAPDTRRCGESKGKGITFGYFERNDAEQWIEEIYKMDPKAEIGIFGISLGAATAILTASLRSDIKYVISYCSYASFKEIILDKGRELYPKMIKILYPGIALGGYMLTGARMDLVDVESAISNVNCPILLMHSKDDEFTPFKHAEKLYKANPKAQFMTFDGAPHAKAYSKNPKLYKKYVFDFLDSIKI